MAFYDVLQTKRELNELFIYLTIIRKWYRAAVLCLHYNSDLILVVSGAMSAGNTPVYTQYKSQRFPTSGLWASTRPLNKAQNKTQSHGQQSRRVK